MANLVPKLVTAAAAILASIVARKTTDGTWKFVTGSDSPENPEDPDIDLKEAIAFAVLSGAVVGLARMLANRQATRLVAKGQGKHPQQVGNTANA
ncbi:DUF4235 domain-containing protein [Ornithinimicrobium pekingense]|uniref:DUF4235 domain-containing protein n=1 Tax=Ornithinimicrobium pekingense TaxID=384677 RepID=A0ABQ2FB10_9MICO|nr:DUF4235 domain-containing protein [Ornithinimicrobium pekingense]GGK79290.1 hypothetical protein GCM10011509_29760 [Ornithinimicrobium pekingense]